tara:strand:+ start:300 stop:641 length:342 start_codon:yes stop_codon:yes gene_type:complete
MTNNIIQLLNLPIQPTPSELYEQLCNLQKLVTHLTDEQLEQTIQWCTITNSDNDDEVMQLMNTCINEQIERLAWDYLTQEQTADLLGNDNAHYVWDGDDLFYLAHPDQHDDNY